MDTESTTYNISKHAEERYSSRVMGKEDIHSINCFIAENKEKIKTDLNKMITYGTLIYSGKRSQKDRKGNVIDVYLKDTWCVLVDSKSEVIVTVYRIDFGLDDDFNNLYITGMIEKLNEAKENLISVQMQVDIESKMYNELIEDSQAQINEYKAMIKNLENLCDGYKTIVSNNTVKIAQANREVADIVNKMIGKREF